MRLVAAAPLEPSGDQARQWLQRELLDPSYHDQHLLERLVGWLQRRLGTGLAAAAEAPLAVTAAAVAVLLLLALGLLWLLSRARVSAAAPRPVAVPGEDRLTGHELRARAEASLASGRYGDAVVEAFRALAGHQIEAGMLTDVPGATAHEVAEALAGRHPVRGEQIRAAGALFDRVLYGRRPATREQALAVLALDDALAAVR